MGIHVIRVPDIGEGIAETEIAEWLVVPGDLIAEDQPVAAVMTDKATVEIPSPVAGKVVSHAAGVGETLAVGGELMRLEVEGAGNLRDDPELTMVQIPGAEETKVAEDNLHSPVAAPIPKALSRPVTGAPLAAPTVRALARERGLDLRLIPGSGPEGRILREDVERFDPHAHNTRPQPDHSVETIKIAGLRKRISQRMDQANRIPHITIVEEVDATALEALRQSLNARLMDKGTKLTLLPFVVRALVSAVADQPTMNSHHDAEGGLLRQFGGVHVGIAAQTPTGLVVPVLRHAEALSLTASAAEIARLADAAKAGQATREELSGSTITITSLGALGALATTPILNVPEVAIVGINRMAVRPFWNGTTFEPRRMMNISCSFDHRVIDGWDAAVFVQRLKELLETPALLFVEIRDARDNL